MADVYVNALTTISTEPGTTDSVVCVNRNTNEGQIIDYNLLADKILDKLASKQYSALTTTSKLITGAINELDSDVASLNSRATSYVKIKDYTIENVTVAAGATAWPTPPTISESGYEPIGIVGYYIYAPGGYLVPYSQRIVNGAISLAIRNPTSTDTTGGTITVYVLFRKTN